MTQFISIFLASSGFSSLIFSFASAFSLYSVNSNYSSGLLTQSFARNCCKTPYFYAGSTNSPAHCQTFYSSPLTYTSSRSNILVTFFSFMKASFSAFNCWIFSYSYYLVLILFANRSDFNESLTLLIPFFMLNLCSVDLILNSCNYRCFLCSSFSFYIVRI